MPYEPNYNNPGEFFNRGSITTGYVFNADPNESITLGCSDHGTDASKLLTHLSGADADASTGSTAQVVFALNDLIHSLYHSLDAADKPSKFVVTKSSYGDNDTGETVITYNTTIRVTPGSLSAVNS